MSQRRNRQKTIQYQPRAGKHTLAVKRSYTGLGLFTDTVIKRGDFIIEYYGHILKKGDTMSGKYLFEVNEKRTIDGSPRNNLARYINHSCRANCEARITRNKVYIYAKRNIKFGEEITCDYGEEYVNEFIRPYGCKCAQCRDT